MFLVSEGEATISNICEWCAGGIEPQIDGTSESTCRRFFLVDGETAPTRRDSRAACRRLEPQASAEKDLLESQNIQSLLVVPLSLRRSLLGFVGFDSVRTEKTWSKEDVALLRILGELISNALNRQQTEKALRESEEKMRSIFHVAPIGIGVALDRTILDVNEQFCDMTGYARDELIGQKHSLVISHG